MLLYSNDQLNIEKGSNFLLLGVKKSSKKLILSCCLRNGLKNFGLKNLDKKLDEKLSTKFRTLDWSWYYLVLNFFLMHNQIDIFITNLEDVCLIKIAENLFRLSRIASNFLPRNCCVQSLSKLWHMTFHLVKSSLCDKTQLIGCNWLNIGFKSVFYFELTP